MKRNSDRSLTVLVLVVGFANVLAFALTAAVRPAVPSKAEPFDLRYVRLLDGPFKTAMELNARYLLSLEPDRLLSGMRENAGLKPKAPRYGGWESQGVAGQTLGHYMTALAQLYSLPPAVFLIAS